MKQILKPTAYILFITAVTFASCKKMEKVSSPIPAPLNPVTANKPPVANAGADQTIYLPQDTVELSGILSYDTDGSITKFFWSKISGPTILGPINIAHADSSAVTIKFITIGEYVFQLQVTDDKGATSKATVKVILKDNPAPTLIVNARVVEYNTGKPIAGATLHIRLYTKNISTNESIFTSDANGICSFQSNNFGDFYVSKEGYWDFWASEGHPSPVIFSPDNIRYRYDDPVSGSYICDTVTIKLFPKHTVTIHIKDSLGLTVCEECSVVFYGRSIFRIDGKTNYSWGTGAIYLRPFVDTTFQYTAFGNIENEFSVVGDYCDGYCSKELLRKTQYISNGNNINLNITY